MTRYAHRARFREINRFVGGHNFKNCADVGCADGLFIRHLVTSGLVHSGTGFDVDEEALAAAQQASLDNQNLQFYDIKRIDLKNYEETFDLVLCLETLEHVREPMQVIEQLFSLCTSGGTILISAPIEVGPILAVKQFGRWLANRQGGYGYEKYPLIDLLLTCCFKVSESSKLYRKGSESLGHRGFDFRSVTSLLQTRSCIFQTRFSPFTRLGPWLNSTAYWLIQKPKQL